jgi:histidinol phosphatase-like PHP family hydrolase
MIKSDDMERVFTKAAAVGVGIELNLSDMSFSDSEADTVLRPFRIAKACGCKFYLGSDAHSADGFKSVNTVFERAVSLLDLSENDKFHIGVQL